MPRVVIVGAGISGLSLAYRLQQQGPDLEITVLEEKERPGGTVGTFRHQGFQVEIGPNGFLETKTSTRELCCDLGLEDQLIAASPISSRNRYLFLDERLRRLPTGLLDFLGSDLLSWRGKAALFLEFFRRCRQKKAQDESIAAFACRRAGSEIAGVLADALVTGIHAGDPELLSMPACFPRLVELERQYGSVLKGLARSARQRRRLAAQKGLPAKKNTGLASLRQGLGSLIDTLIARLHKPPLLGVAVRSLHRQGISWVVQGEGKDAWPADAVVLACPAHGQAAILADLDNALAQRVGSIAYNRIAVVALGYRQQDVPGTVAGFGYIAPQRTRRDLLGTQWCSCIYPERAPAGAFLLRALAGGWHRPEIPGWGDERLLGAVRAELRLAMNLSAAPIFHHIVRWSRAIPQYLLGHPQKIAWIQQRAAQHPGLFLAGNAYYGVALNDCTEQGAVLAEKVLNFGKTRGHH